jgi:hypothetical protein
MFKSAGKILWIYVRFSSNLRSEINGVFVDQKVSFSLGSVTVFLQKVMHTIFRTSVWELENFYKGNLDHPRVQFMCCPASIFVLQLKKHFSYPQHRSDTGKGIWLSQAFESFYNLGFRVRTYPERSRLVPQENGFSPVGGWGIVWDTSQNSHSGKIARPPLSAFMARTLAPTYAGLMVNDPSGRVLSTTMIGWGSQSLIGITWAAIIETASSSGAGGHRLLAVASRRVVPSQRSPRILPEQGNELRDASVGVADCEDCRRLQRVMSSND